MRDSPQTAIVGEAPEWISLIQYGILASGDPSGDPAAPEPEPSPEPAPEPTAVVADPAEPSPEPAPEPGPAPGPDWKDRRISQLTARLRAEEAKNRQAPADPAAPSPAAVGGTSQAELDVLVEQRAAERSAIDNFNRQCNEVATAGRSTFPDFDAQVQSLLSLVDRTDPADAAKYNQFLLAAIETGEAPRLLHQLGRNLNEASRVLSMPPLKMAVEMTRMAAKAAVADPGGSDPSSAPRPIRPVRPSGGSHTAISPDDAERADNLSTKEWMERREQQVATRRQARA